MIVLGLTGGIGSGKSTASEYIRKKGFALIDADQIGRDLTADGQPVLQEINRLFGPCGEFGMDNIEVISGKCTEGNGLVLDRKALARIVFNDSVRHGRFDELIQHEIVRIIDDRIDYLQKNGPEEGIHGILLDAPLLFEAGLESRCDKVILVVADVEERIRRVIVRDGSSEEDVRNRIKNQMSDDAKAEKADYVVDNSGVIETLHSAINVILGELC